MPQLAYWPTTPLSEILKLRSRDGLAAAQALTRIMHVYREPMRAFIAQRIRRDHVSSVEDWTQAFIVKFIETGLTDNWDPAIGHLRHYVARSLHNFIRDQERRLSHRPEEIADPGTIGDITSESDVFHRGWAEVAVTRALERLEVDAHPDEKRRRRVQILRLRYGIGLDAPASYEQIARALGLPLERHEIDNALRAGRRDLLEALREEVSALMSSSAGIDQELWALNDLLEA
jgi:hypothetical protein